MGSCPDLGSSPVPRCFQPLTSETRAEFLQDCRSKYAKVQAMYRHFKGSATKVKTCRGSQMCNARR